MWAKLIVCLKKILHLFDINASSIHMKRMMRFLYGYRPLFYHKLFKPIRKI